MSKFWKLFLVSVFISFATLGVAKEKFDWESVDKQSLKETIAFYSGEYSDISKSLEKRAKSGDAVAAYQLAIMYDTTYHASYCPLTIEIDKGDCRPFIVEVEDFDQSNMEAQSWYKKAMELGHPYAGYMFIKHKIKIADYVDRKLKKQVIQELQKQVTLHDAVSMFMLLDLEGLSDVREQSYGERRQKVIVESEKVIPLLVSEAAAGRKLAMYVLGKYYLNLWDLPKSFAWFNKAEQSGFAIASVYKPMVLVFIEDEKLEEDTVKEIKALSSI